MGSAHPAIPVILAAEGTPLLGHAHERVVAPLEAASQQAPEALPDPWVVRLALRLAEGLLMARAPERAALWVGVAGERLATARPRDRVAHATLTARLALAADPQAPLADTLTEARLALVAAPLDERDALETRIRLVEAEAAWRQGLFGPVLERLSSRLRQANAFARIDDLWRAQRLLGLARQARLDFAGAADAFTQALDVCEAHDAPLDTAETLLHLGQCRLALNDAAGAIEAFTRAQGLAPPDSAPFQANVGALAMARLAVGEPDAAIAEAQQGAVAAARADNHRAYIQWVGVVTHLHRVLGRHEAAYRQLLGIYGTLRRGLGEAAAAPVLGLIDTLRADLGDEAFEALSARLLASQTRH